MYYLCKFHIPRRLYASLVFLVLVLSPFCVFSQHIDTIRTNNPSKEFSNDSIRSNIVPIDIKRKSLSSSKFSSSQKKSKDKPDAIIEPIVVKPHSARKALLLSILPGAGQVYNHQAWKIPIIYAALGTMGYFVYSNYSQMAAFKKEYLFRINNPGQVQLEGYETYPNASIYNLYQSYNQNFQLMIIISAGVYALNLVDAFVFGHLFDFQINDDLAFSFRPSLMSAPQSIAPVPSVGFSLQF